MMRASAAVAGIVLAGALLPPVGICKGVEDMPTLNWMGREKATNVTKDVVMKILREDRDMSYGDTSAENILIRGDNIEAMNALLPFYVNRVKCIYIDPPYNADAAVEGYDDNLEHSTWLSIMYPRLKMLRDFLKEDGLIFVQIDNNEMAYLKVIMDEIFGRDNHLTTITIKVKAPAGVGQESFLFDVNEYILVYAKCLPDMQVNVLKEKSELRENTFEQYRKEITNISEGKKVGLLKSEKVGEIPLMKHDSYEISSIAKKDWNSEYYGAHLETIIRTTNPQGGLVKKLLADIPSDGLYSVSYKPTKGNKKDSEITYYFLNGALVVWLKDSSVLEDGKVLKLTKMTNLWQDNFFQGISGEGNVVFKNSKKPEALVGRILSLASNPGDLVMDVFLGSGTTTAVAHKMGRRWIGVEMGEHAETKCAVRMKSVCKGEQSGISKAVQWRGGGGFRYYELGEAILQKDGTLTQDIPFETMAAHVWFTETKRPYDVPPKKTTVLGVDEGVAYALLYNGILGDKSVGGGNVLTKKTLGVIRDDLAAYGKAHGIEKIESVIVYAEASRLSDDTLKAEKIEFRQTPYDLVVRK